MRTESNTALTNEILDRLENFLSRELENPTLSAQIPDGAHIFHGSHSDPELTQGSLDLATKLLFGMTLGYIEEASLLMVFEYRDGEYTLIELSDARQKQQAQAVIGRFQEQGQKKLTTQINQLLAA